MQIRFQLKSVKNPPSPNFIEEVKNYFNNSITEDTYINILTLLKSHKLFHCLYMLRYAHDDGEAVVVAIKLAERAVKRVDDYIKNSPPVDEILSRRDKGYLETARELRYENNRYGCCVYALHVLETALLYAPFRYAQWFGYKNVEQYGTASEVDREWELLQQKNDLLEFLTEDEGLFNTNSNTTVIKKDHFPHAISPEESHELTYDALINKGKWQFICTRTFRIKVKNGWVIKVADNPTDLFIYDPEYKWEL